MDFSDKSNAFIRPYRNLLDVIGIANDNAGIDLTLDEFRKHATIFAWDNCPDVCNSFHSHIGRPGVIDVNLVFKKPLSVPITVLIYQVYDKILYMEKMHQDGIINCTVEHLTVE